MMTVKTTLRKKYNYKAKHHQTKATNSQTRGKKDTTLVEKAEKKERKIDLGEEFCQKNES